MDTDRDGKISAEEMFAYLEKAEPRLKELNDEQKQGFFDMYDMNKDGFVSWNEFATITLEIQRQ
jgi:Ca2+-binding EF-hand superfamily protein